MRYGAASLAQARMLGPNQPTVEVGNNKTKGCICSIRGM